MKLLDRLLRRKPAETRSPLENPNVNISDRNVGRLIFGIEESIANINVTTELALSVPAVSCAVSFIAGTMATLPLQLFKKTENGNQKVQSPLAAILQHAVNDECSSYKWRKYTFEQVLTEGRAYTFIEKNGAGKVINLWPLDPSAVTVQRRNGRTSYLYRENGKNITYEAREIIDIPFMLKRDMLSHRAPVKMARDAIAMAKAMERYGGNFFNNGGVPPLQLISPINSPAAIKRASEDMTDAVGQAQRDKNNVLAVPVGHELKAIGLDAEKSQMEKSRRFQIEEFARVWNLPPAFLQDLTHGTFSNTEQQDLHYVKHTLSKWITLFEQELNLKLFGARNTRQFVKLNVEGLLRGDYKTRMEGHAIGVQNAFKTPNEIRAMEDDPSDPQGDELLIQGATVPLGSQPTNTDGGNSNAATE